MGAEYCVVPGASGGSGGWWRPGLGELVGVAEEQVAGGLGGPAPGAIGVDLAVEHAELVP